MTFLTSSSFASRFEKILKHLDPLIELPQHKSSPLLVHNIRYASLFIQETQSSQVHSSGEEVVGFGNSL
jgi:hypothetical protein